MLDQHQSQTVRSSEGTGRAEVGTTIITGKSRPVYDGDGTEYRWDDASYAQRAHHRTK